MPVLSNRLFNANLCFLSVLILFIIIIAHTHTKKCLRRHIRDSYTQENETEGVPIASLIILISCLHKFLVSFSILCQNPFIIPILEAWDDSDLNQVTKRVLWSMMHMDVRRESVSKIVIYVSCISHKFTWKNTQKSSRKGRSNKIS